MIKGIDVSHFNPSVNWAKLKTDGCAFTMIKATDGLKFVDRSLHMHAENSAEAGFYRGAYHFLRADQDGAKQADFFLDTIKDLGLEMRAIVDVEGQSVMDQSFETVISCSQDFLNRILEKTKVHALFYTATYFAEEVGFPPYFRQFPLWLANYNKIPRVPPPWQDYLFWQFTDRGEASIEPEGIDTSVFQGTPELLTEFINNPT